VSTEARTVAPSQRDAAVKVETTGWGLFFIWVGICFLADLGWAVFFIGTGVLMLGLQAVRRYVGLRLDSFGLVLGICLVVAGVIHAAGAQLDKVALPDWLLPGAFVAVGAALLISAWKRKPRP
jgi:hypothetical protein